MQVYLPRHGSRATVVGMASLLGLLSSPLAPPPCNAQELKRQPPWSWRLRQQPATSPLVTANETELSVPILRSRRGSDGVLVNELWVWPQAFTATQTGSSSCVYTFSPWASYANGTVDDTGSTPGDHVPPQFLVYTLGRNGEPVSSRYEPTVGYPRELLIKQATTYVPTLDAIVAYSGIRVVDAAGCVDAPALGFVCAASANEFLSTATVLVPSRNIHVFYFQNLTWVTRHPPASDASDWPSSQMPLRQRADGAFTYGLRTVYDPVLDAVIAAGGYQDTRDSAFPSGEYGSVFILNITTFQWTWFNTTTADGAPPNVAYINAVSMGMLVVSTIGGRHELVLFAGVTIAHTYAGGYCYVLNVTAMQWRVQSSCSMFADASPGLLFDQGYAASPDGTRAIAIGGRTGDPSWGWTTIVTDAWELDLRTYSWTRLTIPSDPVGFPRSLVPNALVRSTLFWLPRVSAAEPDALVAWGGVAVNSSFASASHYNPFTEETCTRVFGGQYAATGRYVALPAYFHMIQRAAWQGCREAVPLQNAHVAAVVVVASAPLALAALQGLRALFAPGDLGRKRRAELCFDAASTAVWWVFGLLVCSILALSSSASLGLVCARLGLHVMFAGAVIRIAGCAITAAGVAALSFSDALPSVKNSGPAWDGRVSVLAYRFEAAQPRGWPRRFYDVWLPRIAGALKILIQLAFNPLAVLPAYSAAAGAGPSAANAVDVAAEIEPAAPSPALLPIIPADRHKPRSQCLYASGLIMFVKLVATGVVVVSWISFAGLSDLTFASEGSAFTDGVSGMHMQAWLILIVLLELLHAMVHLGNRARELARPIANWNARRRYEDARVVLLQAQADEPTSVSVPVKQDGAIQ